MYRYHLKVAALTAALIALAFGYVRADSGTSTTIPVGNSPVVRLQMRTGHVTIRTWNQQQIQIDATQPVQTQQFDAGAVSRALRAGDLSILATTVQTPNGPLTLPAEDFSLNSVTPGDHDGVAIFGGDTGATLVVTVPASTALMWVNVGHGTIDIQDYRSGTFVARVHNGGIRLQNVSGDGYVEAARGPIFVKNSAMNRLRARTAVGNILFENCNARQIEVSSISGSIAYDNGTFVPGLARFESQSGNVAIGVAGGGVQIGAHSSSGKIFENLQGAGNVRGGQNDAQATISGGGPVVTASSQSGAVYLYTGSLAGRARLPNQWRPAGRIVHPRFPRPSGRP